MTTTYNEYALVPAPLAKITRATKNVNGKVSNFGYNIVLTGNILAVTGLINAPEGMNSIQGVQADILAAFSESGHDLVMTPPEAAKNNAMTFKCDVIDVTFDSGIWYNVCPYSITLFAQLAEGIDDSNFDNIVDFGESWRVSYDSNNTYQIAHDIFAVGQDTPGVDGSGLAAARSHVAGKTGSYSFPDLDIAFAGYDLPDKNTILAVNDDNAYWNRSSTEQIDVNQNRYAIAEIYVYNELEANRSSIESYEISINLDSNSLPKRQDISISGSVQGVDLSSHEEGIKLTNAVSDWNNEIRTGLFTRLSSRVESGYALNPTPNTISWTENKANGSLTYSASYTARKTPLVANAIEENLSVDDSFSNDIFAEIQVPGRVQGPVTQNMNTKTNPQRTISYSAKMSENFLLAGEDLSSANLLAAYNARPDTDSIFLALMPIGTDIKYYITQNTVSWNPSSLEYSRTLSWTIVRKQDANTYDGFINSDPFNEL